MPTVLRAGHLEGTTQAREKEGPTVPQSLDFHLALAVWLSCFRQSELSTMRASVFWTMNLAQGPQV